MYINVIFVYSLDVSKAYGTFRMKPVVKNGNTFLEIDTLTWKLAVSKLSLKFDNLFNGDKALGKLKLKKVILLIIITL